MMGQRIVCIAIASAGLLAAQPIEFTNGGLIRVTHSTGALTVEAWDKPTVELRTDKPANVIVKSERKGDELEVTTTVPKHTDAASLSYHLWVPRDSRLAIDHAKGEVNVEGVTGDISASLRHGQIFLYLPADGVYTTKAACKYGSIHSDFAGGGQKATHFGLGHDLTLEDKAKGHALDLKVGYGDIIIFKEQPLLQR